MSRLVLSRAVAFAWEGLAEWRAGRGTAAKARQDKSADAHFIQAIGTACLFVRMAGGRYYENGISPTISVTILMHAVPRPFRRQP
jgi:hypothetical protein